MEGATEEITLVGSTEDHLLTQVSAALAAAGVSIEDFTAVEAAGGSIIHMRVDDRERALQILNEHLDIGRCHGQYRPFNPEAATQMLTQANYQTVSQDALLVKLIDKPGALAELMKKCRQQAIAIRSVRLVWRGPDSALVEIASDQHQQLETLLADQVVMQ